MHTRGEFDSEIQFDRAINRKDATEKVGKVKTQIQQYST